MVTIKDIAKEAGVSHGTASNVLNKRGNVSAAKIKLVEEAAKKLGYQLHSSAQILRKGLSNQVYVFMPYQAKEHYSTLIESILFYAEENIESRIYYVKHEAHFNELLSKAVAQAPRACICIGIQPNHIHLKNKEIKFILIDVPKRSDFQFDKTQIQQQVIQFLLAKNPHSVTFLSPYVQYAIFDDLLPIVKKQFNTAYSIVVGQKNVMMTYSNIAHLTQEDMVILTDKQLAKSLRDVFKWHGKDDCPYFLVLGEYDTIFYEGISYLQLDYSEMGQKIIQQLSDVTTTTTIPVGQIVERIYPILPEYKTHLTLAIIDSPMSKALQLIVPKFEQLTGIKINIQVYTYENLLDCLVKKEFLKEVDIIRIDMAWLPNFASDIFQEITHNRLTHEINHYLTSYLPDEYSMIGESQYTFPLDISMQVLVYRKDLFSNTLIQRQYFEQNKQTLAIPETFEQFDRIARFFSKCFNDESPTVYGHTVALKTPIVATCDFMPRYREQLLLHQMDLSQINKTVDMYQKSIQSTDGNLNLWWEDVVGNLSSGQTAMEIVFSNYVSPLFSGKYDNDLHYEFDIASVPGKQAMIGGGAIGISRYSNHTELALTFLKWLYSPEISRLLAYLGGVMPTKTIMNDRQLYKMYPWFENFEETICYASRSRWYDFVSDLEFETLLGQELIEKFKLMKDVTKE